MNDIKGVGSLIEAATKKMGIEPCGGCKKRKEWLDKHLPFRQSLAAKDTAHGLAAKLTAMQQGVWTKYPEAPEGWVMSKQFKANGKHFVMFNHETSGGIKIWEVINGEYKNQKGFCCGTMQARANTVWDELCR